MIKLNPAQFPDDIANALMLRGVGIPPLHWHDKPIRAGKDLLDQLEDDNLFKPHKIVDESMASAVRAMLYLWNGFPGDCDMYSPAAPESEQWYFKTFIQRQAGNTNDAKISLRNIDQHPIYAPLKDFALEIIGLGTAKPLKRFKDIVELCEEWEPYAFMDIYEEVRLGKHCSSTDETIRSIQCREFELLFIHCFEKATGQLLPQPTLEEKRPPKRKPAPKSTRRHRPTPTPESKKKSDKPKDAAKKPAPIPRRSPGGIGIQCPKCQQLDMVPKESRGAKHRCTKCGVAYKIPDKKPAPTTQT